jgi:hypothetical protein
LTKLVTNGNVSWNGATDVAVIGTGAIVRFVVDTISPQSLTNKTLLGAFVNGQYKSNSTAVAALAIDCSLGNYFTKSISTNSTFTITNVPAGVYAFTLELTTSSAAIPTWWSGVYWPEAISPIVSNGVHLFMFVTRDGGTTWHGAYLLNYTA